MFNIIFQDIITAIRQYKPATLISGIFFIAALSILLSITQQKPLSIVISNYKRLLALLFLLFVYIFFIISLTFLSREPGSRDRMDLRLFITFSKNIQDNVYPVENIILFIPLGLMLPVIWNKFNHIFSCLAAGTVLSLAIEISQRITKRGYFQIDDIILNMAGTMVGFAAICGLRKLKSIFKHD